MHMRWRNLAPVEKTFSADTFQSNSKTFFMKVLIVAFVNEWNYLEVATLES